MANILVTNNLYDGLMIENEFVTTFLARAKNKRIIFIQYFQCYNERHRLHNKGSFIIR